MKDDMEVANIKNEQKVSDMNDNFTNLQTFMTQLMQNFASFLEENIGEGGVHKSTLYFQQWLNNQSKL